MAKRRGRRPDPGLAARRRDQILEAATRLFAARGYADADLDDLAGRLGVGKGTVYRYFPAKETLFFAALDRAMRRLLEAVGAGTAAVGDPLKRIAEAIRLHVEYFHRHPDAVELVIQERAHFRDRRKPTYFAYQDANIGPWTALLRALMRAGRVRRVPVGRVVRVIGDLLYGTIFTSHFARSRTDLRAWTQDILDMAFHGMLAPGERFRC